MSEPATTGRGRAGDPPVLCWLSDVEGRWEKLEQACDGQDLRLVCADGDDVLEPGPGAKLVYGGDVVDRGPASRRLLRVLVRAFDTSPEQVILLAGNRDINKLRLPRELGPCPREGMPEPLSERLRVTLSRTMGAAHAWELRAAELGLDPRDEDALVQSFLDDVGTDGPLLAYLRRARLIHREGETLFVHGGVLDENLGVVPGERHPIEDLDAWILALNHFYTTQIDAFCADPLGVGHLELVAYQAPLRGTRANQTSVVYGRPTEPDGAPRLPSPALQRRLKDQGIRRVVVGHTPMGDLPGVLRADGFEQVIGDTSYAPLERGLRARLSGPHTRFSGQAQVDGEIVTFELDLHLDHPSPIGEQDRVGRHRRAVLADGREVWVGFLPGWKAEQVFGADRPRGLAPS